MGRTLPLPFKLVAPLERHPSPLSAVFQFLDGTLCPPCPIIWFSHPVNKKAAPPWLLKGTRNLYYSAQNVAPCARRGPTTPLSGRQLTLFSHSTSTTLGLTQNDKMSVIWDFIKSLAIESFPPKSKFTIEDVSDVSGKVIIVTSEYIRLRMSFYFHSASVGDNSGLGFAN